MKRVSESGKIRGHARDISGIEVLLKDGHVVRGSPPALAGTRRGIAEYKKQLKELRNRVQARRHMNTKWIEGITRLANLRRTSYIANSARSAVVEKYITELDENYRSLASKSDADLALKLRDLDEKWAGELEITVNPGSNSKKSESKKDLPKPYLAEVRRIKDSHSPKVYSPPGTSNFDYLTKAIRMISGRRTICMSIDIEAFEHDTNVVTEIGISIYDPRENLHTLIPMMRNYHLIVAESIALRNRKWVCDFKNCYLLGESTVLPLSQCVEFVQALVDYYLKAQTPEDGTWDRAIVGHNVAGDLKWLTELGVNLPDRETAEPKRSTDINVDNTKATPKISTLDTMRLYSCCYGNNNSSLGKILRLFQLPHAYLHNAGNDAHYTLQLLLHMADVSFRKQMGLDDIRNVEMQIREWSARDSSEDKILPMSYALSVVEALRAGKRRKTVVQQTEFSGSRWFESAQEAFKANGIA